MFKSLAEAYGWKLLGMLACSQWLIKGLVWGFSLTSMEFLLRDYRVPAPKIQVYRSVVMLPWAMKPLLGLVSDALPVCGYQKGPYIVMTSLVAVGAYMTVGLDTERRLPVQMVVGCLWLGCMQVSTVDLLTEARYAAKIRERPEHGPDLMTYVWAGITLGTLFATACAGPLIEWLGASQVYTITAPLAAIVLVPTCLNWLEEVRLCPEAASLHRSKLGDQRELIFLVLLMGGASLLLLAMGLLQESIWVNLAVALVVSAGIGTAFTLALRPIIGRMNCFFFIQTCCVVDISGAVFYFFTDDRKAYPEGPHFSTTFYVSGLGVCMALLNLLGLWIYNRYMQSWRYHSLLIFANLLLCCVNLMGLLVFTRTNVKLGVPDAPFVLATWGSAVVVHMWMWLPAVVLLSQLCPKGVEATMYALLAGCHNLGLSLAGYIGACLLELLGVSPRGAPDEGHQFERLWIAGLVQAVAPVVTLALLPWLVPDALQTEKLLEAGDTAVDGSPWRRLRSGVMAHYGTT